jgi:acetyl esterase/lipase
MAPPRSEAAMAAALPLAGVPAWRVYFGLPMFGSRTPAAGADELTRLMLEDYVLKLFAPVVEQAAAEAPAAIQAVRDQLNIADGPIGLLGGSAGGAVALLTLLESQLSIRAVALVNPVIQLAKVVAAGARTYGVTYTWTDASRAAAKKFDFIARAGEIANRGPKPAVLLVGGGDDEPEFREPLATLADTLSAAYEDHDLVRFISVPGMGHAVAEEPGTEPAPQTNGAIETDRVMADWFRSHLG